MFPKMIPFSVLATLSEALMDAKSCGASVIGAGLSTSRRSPSVASSSETFCSVSPVRFTSSTSSTMSNCATEMYASA